MPKGSKAVAKAVEEKVRGWGNGAVGNISVSWKNKTSWHSVSIINQNGTVVIYDAQCNKVYPDLQKFFSRTYAIRTQLFRLDNAPLKKDIQNDLKKMVKQRDPREARKHTVSTFQF